MGYINDCSKASIGFDASSDPTGRGNTTPGLDGVSGLGVEDSPGGRYIGHDCRGGHRWEGGRRLPGPAAVACLATPGSLSGQAHCPQCSAYPPCSLSPVLQPHPRSDPSSKRFSNT